MRLCKVVSLTKGSSVHFPAEARRHLGIPDGKPAKLLVYLAQQGREKIVVIKKAEV